MTCRASGGEPRQRRPPAFCGGCPGLRRASFHRPTSHQPPHALSADHRCGPGPAAPWRMTAFHGGADQEAGLAAARTALQNTRSGDNAEGLSDQAAMRADKAVRPAGTPKIGSARRIIGKQLLKLRERSGESQIVALMDVNGRHDGQTLALVGVCVNRIGKHQTGSNYNWQTTKIVPCMTTAVRDKFAFIEDISIFCLASAPQTSV